MAWTQNQIDAIEATDGSVLVSAAAGSGKTSVLSERVIRMITRRENTVPADRLLIVTFTKDAAAEMKQRINQKLNALIESGEGGEELIRQKQRFYNATVSTIDSFCGSLVREFFHRLGVSSDYRIVDESELALIKQKALDNTFRKFYAENSESFKSLVKSFLYKSGDRKLRDAVLKISTFLECVPFPENWLDNALKDYEISSVGGTKWGREILSNALDTLEYLMRIVIRSVELCKEDSDLAVRYDACYREAMPKLSDIKRSIIECRWDEASSKINSLKDFEKLKAMPAAKGMSQRLEFSSYKKLIPKLIDELKDIFRFPEKEIINETSQSKPAVAELFRLVKDYERELRELKLKKNVLHFADTSHLTVNLLAEYDGEQGYVKTELAREISRRYDAVIVDEYQDINEVQDLIFNCVSNGRNLFVVGDVKQSIYTFRQTRPRLFTNRRDSYCRYDRDNPSYPATIYLDKNFRSRSEVCDTVNFMFRLLMSKKTADIDYTDDDLLNVGAEYGDSDFCQTEIALLDCDKIARSIVGEPEGKKKLKLDSKTGESKTSVEVRFIAKRIKELMNCGYLVTDKGTLRPAEYRDFAVIMRSPGSSGRFKQKDDNKKGAAEIVRLLKNFGIPAYCDQSDSLFDNREIMLLLNLLRVIDNPINDIPLLSVLISPVFGFTPDELALIRAHNRYQSLYESLKSYSELSEKVKAFLNQLDSLRRYSASVTVDELLGKIYDLTALGAITSAVKGGAAPTANLNLMRLYAKNYQANGYKSLSDFIGFIDRLVSHRESLQSAPGLDSSTGNRVRVLSIHKSKGLEFPVCFLIDTAHGFNKEDFQGSMLIDSENGIGIRRVSGLVTADSAARKAIILKKQHELIADELRLLYVALTRAREKLIITSTVDSADAWIEEAVHSVSNGMIDPFIVSKSNCMLKWILAAAAANPYTAAQMKGEELPKECEAPKWKFRLIKNIAQLNFHVETVEKSEEKVTESPVNYAEILRYNLSFRYRNEKLLSLPQKVSASEIAHRQSEFFETVISVPKFIERKELSATERGTAHHEFLRYCDFESARENPEAERDRLLAQNHLTEKQAESIDIDKLSDILNNKFFERVLSSGHVYREERFTVEISPALIDDSFSDITQNVGCIMQGAVDLAFEENGKLVIVDYKTDYVKNASELIERYKKQLELYKEALTQTLSKEVEELYIFSICLNEVIKV